MAGLLICILALVGSSPGRAEAPVTLKVWMMGLPYEDRTVDGRENKGIHNLFDEFQKLNPGIRIDYQDIGWMNTEAKIMTSMIGEGPDVYMIGTTWMPKFVAKGGLMNLAPLLEKEPFDFSKFHERYHQMARVRDLKTGRQDYFGLPFIADCRILAYDKTIFDHYKVDPPHDTMTWEEMLEKAKKVTGEDPVTHRRTFGYMLKGADPTFQFMSFLYQNGGRFYNEEETKSALESPEAVEALRFYSDLHTKHRVCGDETMSNTLWSTFGAFLDEENKYAMQWTVPAMVKAGAIERKSRIGVCKLPTRKGTGGLMGGCFLSINAKSAHAEAAYKLLVFMASRESQKFVMEQFAQLSPRNDLGDWEFIRDNPEWRVAIEQFSESYNTPGTDWEESYNIIGEYVQNTLLGAMSPEEACGQMAAEIDHVLQNARLQVRSDPAEIERGLLFLTLAISAFAVTLAVFLAAWGVAGFRRQRPGESLSGELWTRRAWYVLISPVILIIATFIIYPLFESIRLSFVASDGLNVLAFVGFDNYEFVLGNAKFWNAVSNTFILTGLEFVTVIPLALLLSVLINEQVRAKTFFKVVYFMPVVTSYVAISIVWELILLPGDEGLLNGFLRLAGVAPMKWLADPAWSKPSLAIMDTWRWMGFVTMVFLAGLQGIPEALYEAAKIDGARAVDRFFHVTLPMLKPALSFVILTHAIGSLQMFDQIFILGGMRGGVQRSYQSIVSYLYEVGFGNHHFGVASAVAYVLFFLIAVVTALGAVWLKPHQAVE